MIESATGLILRTRPLTETSLIVHWLTPGFGRIATVAKGARRPKSPFLGKLDLFYQADFTFSRSRRSELHTLREVRLLDTHPALRQEVLYLQQAAYCTRLLEQATETDTPLPAVFELLSGLLKLLPRKPPAPQPIFAFELKLLNELGLQPDLEKCHLTSGTKQLVNAMLTGNLEAISRLRLSEAQEKELRPFLHGYLVFHLGRIPEGRIAGLAA
jgi:DNA repair protein RecO (recombination protein O)